MFLVEEYFPYLQNSLLASDSGGLSCTSGREKVFFLEPPVAVAARQTFSSSSNKAPADFPRTVLYFLSLFLTLSKKTKKGEVRDKQEAIQSAIYAKAFSNGTPFGENVVTEREMRE